MPVELTTLDDCALLRLNRPEALNALSFGVLKEISDALTEVAIWKVRALIVTGAGEKAFCAGADIKELGGRPLIDCKRGAELGQAIELGEGFHAVDVVGHGRCAVGVVRRSACARAAAPAPTSG